MDYVVAGTVQMTIIPPGGKANTFTLEPSDVAFVPQGYAHSILNIGDVEAVIPITFNNELPDDIGLSHHVRRISDRPVHPNSWRSRFGNGSDPQA